MTHYHLRRVDRVDRLKSQKVKCPATASSKPLLLCLHAQSKAFSKQADKEVAPEVKRLASIYSLEMESTLHSFVKNCRQVVAYREIFPHISMSDVVQNSLEAPKATIH